VVYYHRAYPCFRRNPPSKPLDPSFPSIFSIISRIFFVRNSDSAFLLEETLSTTPFCLYSSSYKSHLQLFPLTPGFEYDPPSPPGNGTASQSGPRRPFVLQRVSFSDFPLDLRPNALNAAFFFVPCNLPYAALQLLHHLVNQEAFFNFYCPRRE